MTIRGLQPGWQIAAGVDTLPDARESVVALDQWIAARQHAQCVRAQQQGAGIPHGHHEHHEHRACAFDEEMVNFAARQVLDRLAPSNFFAANPVVQRETARLGGANLRDGWLNLVDDVRRTLEGDKYLSIGATRYS